VRASFVLFILLLSTEAVHAEKIRLAERPCLSPDGKTIVFSWRDDLWSVPAGGGRAHRLTAHPAADRYPCFSPDGKQLAFVSNREGPSQVFRMDAAGGRPTQVTFHSEGATLQDWLPDGAGVLAAGRRDHYWRRSQRLFLKRLAPDAAPLLLFDGYARDAKLSPDGRHVLFTREGTRWWRKGYTGPQASQVWTFDTAARRFEKLSKGDHEERWPLWAPDNRRCYVVSAEDRGAANLFEIEIEGGERKQLTRFADDGVGFPAISRDGSRIVFRRLFHLYVLDLAAGREPRRLEIESGGDVVYPAVRHDTLTTATQVAFSDDGREIALIAGGDLWVMDTELKEPRRITFTPEEERDPVFAPDHKSILFVSERGGRCDLWRATRADEKKHWWQNREFVQTRLTDDPQAEHDPRFVPGGRVTFTNLRGDVWSMKPDGTGLKLLVESWNTPAYDISPDGRWIAYALDDNDFNRDIWIRRTDGSGEPQNVSRHPDWESDPRFSPDGRILAFLGQRNRDESDIHYVFLSKRAEDQSKRDRTIEKALEKMKQRRKPGGKKKPGKQPQKKPEPAPPTVIDLENISDRIRRVEIPDSEETELVWAPDSKRLAFLAKIDGKDGVFTVSIPDDPKPKLLFSGRGSQARWLKEGDKLVWLQAGRPASVAKGKATIYSFRVRSAVDLKALHGAAFDLAWRAMRDHFYDPRLNNRDWDAVKKKYRPAAASVAPRELEQSVAMMLGELNGSHLGFFMRSNAWRKPGWTEATGHLGVRFDLAFAGPGVRIREVIRNTPAWRAGSRLHAGEIILKIDGEPVRPQRNLGRLLAGPPGRELLLSVQDKAGGRREVAIRPVSFSVVRQRLYEQWLAESRARVDRWSNHTLGYLHVRGMNWRSFERFEAELYKVGHGKQGLVIDVRDNGGGFTTDHLLTSLTQPVHAITVPRGGGPGYPQGRMVYARWQKPIVVLCNQNSFSNAEIFAHAIKTLGRGRLVGVRTAGGVISTGGRSIMGVGFLRMPFRGWFLGGSGEDMERNGAVPDVTIWPRPTEMPRGIDRQLEKAVELLLVDVVRWQARPRPKLKKASSRG